MSKDDLIKVRGGQEFDLSEIELEIICGGKGLAPNGPNPASIDCCKP